MRPYPPLGLLYSARTCAAAVFLLKDSTFQSRKHAPCHPSVLGVYATTRTNVVKILREAKQAGGPEPGAYVDEYSGGRTCSGLGEGELTLEELLPAWSDNRSRPSTNRGNRISRERRLYAAHRAARSDRRLDAQPWPDAEAIDVERYVETWRTHHGKGSVSLDYGSRLSFPLPVVEPIRFSANASPPSSWLWTSWNGSSIATNPTCSGLPTTYSPSITWSISLETGARPAQDPNPVRVHLARRPPE